MTNKISKLIGIVVTLVVAGFISVSPVLAVTGTLTVDFHPNPLFGAVNFLPGESVTSQVEVGNHSGVTKPIAIEAINVDDPDHFGDVLNLRIKEGSNVIFDNTLAKFFNQGETFLSNLADNTTTSYDLIITFQPAANNDYQDKVLRNFDILVGFRGEETPPTPPGQGGGGGGYVLPPGLIISGEADKDIATSTVTITWYTNYLSTSRVIYGAEGEAHEFDFTLQPNYGYAHSTIDDLNKVIVHSVALIGLTPGTTYYYRVISHASPDTVSTNHSFTTLALGGSGEQPAQNPPSENNNPANPPIISGTANPGNSLGAGAAGSLSGETTGSGENKDNLVNSTSAGEVAGAFTLGSGGFSWWWVLLALLAIIVILLFLWLLRRRRENDGNQNQPPPYNPSNP